MKQVLQVEHLEKSYKKKRAVGDVSFNMNVEEILCLLGPNGAGKSTTITMLSGVLKPDKGQIRYEGKGISRASRMYQKELGIVPQDLALYEELSAEQNIKFFASLYGIRGKLLAERTKEVLAFAGLTAVRKDKVQTYSGGMKRRLNIACALAHHPKVLIMDEPTVGIDPQSRNYILESIQKLKDTGMTILYTTHYMEEAEAISTRIIIMDEGRIIAEGTKESLCAGTDLETVFLNLTGKRLRD